MPTYVCGKNGTITHGLSWCTVPTIVTHPIKPYQFIDAPCRATVAICQTKLEASVVPLAVGDAEPSEWKFLGISMSLNCMTSLLGMHRRRLLRAAAREMFLDARCRYQGIVNPTKRPPVKTMHVDGYFLKLYYNEGEPTPLDRLRQIRSTTLHLQYVR